MSGSVGKAIRLARILSGKQGRSACLAFDHGLHVGPIAGVADLRAGIQNAVEAGFDGIILTPGAVARNVDLLSGRDKPSVVMRIDQTTMWRLGSFTGYKEGDVRAITTVEEAAAMGADAVLSYIFIAHKDPALETRSAERAAETAMQSRRLGLAYVAEPMVARNGMLRSPFDPKAIAIHTRMAVEFGADIIKADWPGSVKACKEVLAGCAGTPMLVAGGERGKSDEDTLRLLSELLEGGAKGIMFGRALFQSPDPLKIMKIAREMIHDDLPLPQALKKLGNAPARRRA
jgi:DhnA family fructose-bisphosphate aldolase class Ia